jgi:hypothetical protein
MNAPHSNILKLSKVLVVVIACSVISLAFTSRAITQNSGGGAVEGDHGDNPVIGSLPIKFLPELDVLFGDRGSRAGIPFGFPVPVLGFLSADRLTDEIVTAAGVPFGGVNSVRDDDIFGLARNGLAVVYRNRLASGKLDVKQWLTSEFIGGQIIISTNSGVYTQPIHSDLVKLPLRRIVNQGDVAIYADIEIVPNPNSGSNPLRITVSTYGGLVTIVYTAQ